MANMDSMDDIQNLFKETIAEFMERRYVVVKATAGFAVCRLILKLLLFYSCLDFTQNWGETRNKSFISIGGIKYGRVNYC